MKKLHRLNLYQVESIENHKVDNQGNIFYLVKWLGWEHKFNTWEPLHHLSTVKDLIKLYQKKIEHKKSNSAVKKEEDAKKREREEIKKQELDAIKRLKQEEKIREAEERKREQQKRKLEEEKIKKQEQQRIREKEERRKHKEQRRRMREEKRLRREEKRKRLEEKKLVESQQQRLKEQKKAKRGQSKNELLSITFGLLLQHQRQKEVFRALKANLRKKKSNQSSIKSKKNSLVHQSALSQISIKYEPIVNKKDNTQKQKTEQKSSQEKSTLDQANVKYELIMNTNILQRPKESQKQIKQLEGSNSKNKVEDEEQMLEQSDISMSHEPMIDEQVINEPMIDEARDLKPPPKNKAKTKYNNYIEFIANAQEKQLETRIKNMPKTKLIHKDKETDKKINLEQPLQISNLETPKKNQSKDDRNLYPKKIELKDTTQPTLQKFYQSKKTKLNEPFQPKKLQQPQKLEVKQAFQPKLQTFYQPKKAESKETFTQSKNVSEKNGQDVDEKDIQVIDIEDEEPIKNNILVKDQSLGLEQVLLNCKNYSQVKLTFHQGLFYYEIPYVEQGAEKTIILNADQISKVNPKWLEGYFEGFYL